MDRFKPTFEEEALDYLSHYDWPGNIRQLQNVVQRILFINENKITKDHITFALGLKSNEIGRRSKDFLDWFDKENIIPLREIERKFRTKYFDFVQEMTKSDAEAARMLGLAPPNYYRMCKELGLK